MRFKRLTVVFSALALVTLAGAPHVAAAESRGAGLWSSTFSAGQTSADCGIYALDANNFCWANDFSAGVQLGVKFQSSRTVQISGVRVYRVDSGTVTGSLWSAAGGPAIATGTFSAASTAGHGWQDLTFSHPVTIVPGQTYIASYYSPNSQYAFQYEYFTHSAWAAGPITALQSVQGDPNGVYCYDVESCNHFPVNTYRDSNYWVTPLWSYQFTGFMQPVDTDVWNSAKAGSAIPVKFALGGNLGLDVLKAGHPTATVVACPGANAVVDAIETTVNAGNSSLTYDQTAGQYVYVWKTDKAWAGKCMRFELGLNDDTSRTFSVQFK